MSGMDPIRLNIPDIPDLTPLQTLDVAGQTSPQDGSFGKLFQEMVSQTDQHIHGAEKTVKDLVSGALEHPHQAMVKLEQANLALQFTIQARNKVLEAYNEIMRMQI